MQATNAIERALRMFPNDLKLIMQLGNIKRDEKDYDFSKKVNKIVCRVRLAYTQLTFTCSRSTIETLEKTSKTLFWCFYC